MTHFNSKAMPTNDVENSCHTKAVELVWLIVWSPYHTISCHKLLIASEADTHTNTYRHLHKSNIKKLCTCPPVTSACQV